MDAYAVITGAGSGIGRALAIELCSNYNIKVFAIGRRAAMLKETAALCNGMCTVVAADISTTQGLDTIAAAVQQTPIQFLVQNAAVLHPVKSLMDISEIEWQQHLDINLSGPLFLVKRLLKNLQGGRILHISSGAAHHAYAGWGAYCTSKVAFFMFHQVLKKELVGHSIHVGSVRPGVVRTAMQQQVRQSDPAAFPQLDRFQKLHKQGQLADPEAVAQFLGRMLCTTADDVFSACEYDFREDADKF